MGAILKATSVPSQSNFHEQSEHGSTFFELAAFGSDPASLSGLGDDALLFSFRLLSVGWSEEVEEDMAISPARTARLAYPFL